MANSAEGHKSCLASSEKLIFPLLRQLPDDTAGSSGSKAYLKALKGSSPVSGKPSYPAEIVDGTNLPPKLEETIPNRYLPVELIVVADRRCVEGQEGKHASSNHPAVHQLRNGMKSGPTHRYERVLPPIPIDDTEHTGEDIGDRKATLWLSTENLCGVGHHSSVHLAPFQLPEPLSTNSRSVGGKVSVVAKLAYNGYSGSNLKLSWGDASDREHLANEARIIHAMAHRKGADKGDFGQPHDPVIPKFYGYYVPEDRGLGPILLLEHCGEPVATGNADLSQLSMEAKKAIRGKFDKLHSIGLVHNSPFDRNILKQKGPLSVSPSQRSWATPLYRIIDFGRSEFKTTLSASRSIKQEEKDIHKATKF